MQIDRLLYSLYLLWMKYTVFGNFTILTMLTKLFIGAIVGAGFVNFGFNWHWHGGFILLRLLRFGWRLWLRVLWLRFVIRGVCQEESWKMTDIRKQINTLMAYEWVHQLLAIEFDGRLVIDWVNCIRSKHVRRYLTHQSEAGMRRKRRLACAWYSLLDQRNGRVEVIHRKIGKIVIRQFYATLSGFWGWHGFFACILCLCRCCFRAHVDLLWLRLVHILRLSLGGWWQRASLDRI